MVPSSSSSNVKICKFSESPLNDVNVAPHTIPTNTITETNKLVYTTATVILDMLCYTMNTISHHKGS